MTTLHTKRFAELTDQLKSVEATKHHRESAMGFSGERVDDDLLLNWRVKVKNLLSKVCGLESEHYKHFERGELPSTYTTNYETLKKLKAVFLAAKEDFEGGYLSSLRGLVQAELFDSELDQASELLRSGYHSAAAVVAGVVLETTLRDLCTRNDLSYGKVDKMNADLAKQGVYNVLVQKRITTLAHIRNAAAHGKPDEFTAKDVEAMIEDVQRFVADHVQS